MSVGSFRRRSSPRLAAALWMIFTFTASAPEARADVAGVPWPRGARTFKSQGAVPADPHVRVSGQSFRRTVTFYERWLAKRGAPHEAIPIYRFGGVTVARFLSRAAGSKWLAIQVFLDHGRTMVAIVPRRTGTP